MKEKIVVKPVRKPMTKSELELHQRQGHDPYDSRCKECLLGGIKDRPHYRRSEDREEITRAIDTAGRFKPGRGEDGNGYKYLMIATFKAANRNWKEFTDEATEEVQKEEKEKEKDTEDVFHPQDPVPDNESIPAEQAEKKEETPVSEDTIVLKAIRIKGVKSSSSTGERRVLTERGGEEDEDICNQCIKN